MSAVKVAVALSQPIAGIAGVHRISVSQFARDTGLSRAECSKVFNGTLIPTEDFVRRAASYFSCEPSLLFRAERAPIGPRTAARRRGGAR